MADLLLANFSISTWLAAGACAQSILFLTLPRHVALLPAVILLLLRLAKGVLITQGYIHNTYTDGAFMHKGTAPIPNDDGSIPAKAADKGLVVFILGANTNHPMGLFAPGFKNVGDFIQNMWKDAEANREKWGYLGKTNPMPMATAGGNALVTISYWKDIEHLHAFALGPTHRLGWDWWAAQNKKYPHLGIMHETYAVPKGAWENIYQNCHPLGMGQIKYPVRESKDAPPKLVGTIMQATGGKWRTMTSRMGGKEDEGGEY